MNQNCFYPGDRVVCCVGDGRINPGQIGTVCSSGYMVGVDWDQYIFGHNCMGKCRQGHGWFIPENCIGLLNEQEDSNQLSDDCDII